MSNKQPKSAQPSATEAIDVQGETLSATSVAPTPPPQALSTQVGASGPVSDLEALTASYEKNVLDVSQKLETIAMNNPEFGAKLAEVIAYTIARVDGVVGNQQIPIPFIAMRQATTKEDSLPDPDTRMGELYSKTDRLGPKLDLIPLLTHGKRVKFIQGANRPDCSSEDGITGRKYGKCEVCPHRQRDEASGNRSACSSGHAFAFVTADFTQLFMADFMKTNAQAGKRLKQLAMKPQGLYSSVFTLSTKKDKNERGEEYFVFQVAPAGKKVEGPEYEAARLLSHYFSMRHAYSVARQGLREDSEAESTMHIPAGVGGETSADAGPDFSAGAL